MKGHFVPLKVLYNKYECTIHSGPKSGTPALLND